MFSVFPSDLQPTRQSAIVPSTQVAFAPVEAGSVAAFRRRFADGQFVYAGASLPYPASLPTSGINPSILEFHRGGDPSRLTNTQGAVQPPASRGTLNGYTAPAVLPDDAPGDTTPSASTQTQRLRQLPRTIQTRQLVVPVLSDSSVPPGSPYQKAVVDRVAFDFSQRSVDASPDEDVVRKVLLDDKAAFDKWLEVQSTLQNWLREDAVDMKKQADAARKRAADAREAAGRGKPRAYNRTKPTMKCRIVYLCDHAKRPEPSRAKEPVPDANGKKRKRRAVKPSIKVDCKAKMIVNVMADGSVGVRVEGKHSNHDPRSAQSITESRMPTGVREWIDQRVAERMNAQAIYDHIAISEATIEKYESSSSDEDETPSIDTSSPMLPPMLYNFRVNMDYIRARIRHHSNLRRRPTGPNGEVLAELEACGALLTEIKINGGWSYTHIGQSPDGPYDVVAFASKWQLKILRKHGGTVMMDATHNVAKGLNGGKSYLYTLIVKNKTINRGTPVAFMMTQSSSQYPVELFLRKLFSDEDAPSHSRVPHTLMIDCSRTEQAAISHALPKTKVLYCHYHFWKAVNANLDKKVGKGTGTSITPGQRNAARDLIRRMVKSKTEEDFNIAWNLAQREWSAQGAKWQAFLKYFTTQWHYQVEEWAGYSRKYEHGGIDTNNYLESWHQKLKRNYIRKRNLNMPDVIAMLTREIIPLYRFAHLRVSKGFGNVTLTAAERGSRARAMEYDETDMMHCVQIPEEESKIILVRSLQDPRIYYTISCVGEGKAIHQMTCSCPSYQGSHDRCKHLFLVERYLESLSAVIDELPIASSTTPAVAAAVPVQDLRSSLVHDLASIGAAGTLPTAGPTHAFDAWIADIDEESQSEEMQGEDREVAEDSHDVSHHTTHSARLASQSPAPPSVLERQTRDQQESLAIQETWNELTETLHKMSIASPLAERHDQERMRNMVAQLQSMISTWPEAIGQRQPGAAQRR